MGLFQLFKDALFPKNRDRPLMKAKCPKCKTDVDTRMERCPNCGTHIEAMFRIKCPECGTANKLDARECVKCRHGFYAPSEATARKTVYTCPICGYRADFYMSACPACGTRFA